MKHWLGLSRGAPFRKMPGSPLSSEELRLAKMWYNEDGVAPSEIARRLRRTKSTITRAVVQELPRGGRGRKRVLSDAAVDATIKRLERLVGEAGGRKEVTLDRDRLPSCLSNLSPRAA